MLRSLKILFVAPIIFEFALIRRVIATDLRPSFVDATHVIGAKMLARRVDKEIPNVVVHKHARSVVQQIPTHEVKVASLGRLIDREREIVTTFCGAMFTQIGRIGVVGTASLRGRRHRESYRHPGNRGFEVMWERFKLMSVSEQRTILNAGDVANGITNRLFPVGSLARGPLAGQFAT